MFALASVAALDAGVGDSRGAIDLFRSVAPEDAIDKLDIVIGIDSAIIRTGVSQEGAVIKS